MELTGGGYILINYREKGKPADNKGIFAQGVNFNAKKGIIAKSDGNIYIQGVKDKLNSTYDSHTTKSFAGIKYKRTSDYVSDNREKYKHSQLYGESGVTLDSQGRLRVQGIDIQTIGPVYLKGVKGVEILSGNEVSGGYEIHTSKNFKIGSDKVLKIEQNKNTKELLKMPKIAKKLLSGKDLNEALAGNEGAIEEANLIANGPKSGNAETGLYLSGNLTNTKQSTKIINSIGSNLIAKNNITLKSGDDINLTMVNIISKNIFIDALKNINIYAGKSTVESRESTKSLSGSYNLLTDQFSIGANATKDKLEAESYSNSKIIGENINIKGKDLTI